MKKTKRSIFIPIPWMRYRALVGFSFSILLLVGCNEKPMETPRLNTAIDNGHVFNEEVELIRSQVLESSELNLLIKGQGVAFDPTVLSQPELCSSYINSLEMATNIGVYIADLNYLFAYNEDASRRSFLDAIFYLAEKLDVENAFDRRRFDVLISDGLLTQTEKIDFLKMLVAEAEDKINTEERAQLVALILSGSWIEGMYINFTLSKEAWPNEVIGNAMLDHLESYDRIRKILAHFKGYQPCDDRLHDMNQIESMVQMIQEGDVMEINNRMDEINQVMAALRMRLIQP